ncbi:hypothetical protein [Porphyromonas loveana]|uniref:hypothetical protein n=1 Tax=Porphyromonas loveana TaxID=1884669 RepID=UPI0035A157A2
MNTSKALNIVLAIALVILTVKIVFFSPRTEAAVTKEETTEKQLGKPHTASVNDGKWKAIAPSELSKNAVELFAQDWMALAVGKEGDMNAMTISWGTLGELWGHPVVTVYVSSSATPTASWSATSISP